MATKKTAKEEQTKTFRELVLEEAAMLTAGDRQSSYGDPVRNMECFQELKELFNKYAEAAIEDSVSVACSAAHDGAMTMVLAKLARIICGRSNRDNYVDAAAYLAMAWEAEERQGE